LEVGCEEYGLTLNTYDRGDDNIGKHIFVNLKNAAGDLPDELVAYVSDFANFQSTSITAADVTVSATLTLGTAAVYSQNTKLSTGQNFNSTNAANGVISMLYNEADGGDSQCQNVASMGLNEMYVGTNSAGDGFGLQDFVEIYAKTTTGDGFDDANVGTRLFITPGAAGGFGINAGNDKEWTTTTGVSQCDAYFTNVGLHVTGDIWLTGVVRDNGSSHTVTHRTNIIGFTPEQIGTFAESTGELADVYGIGYVPTLEHATDAICKVRHSTAFSSKIVGIIVGPDTFANSGDVLCVLVNDDAKHLGVQ
jgi:hypothetical protein